MARTKVDEWSIVAASNTDVGGVDIAPRCLAANLDDGIREAMSQIAKTPLRESAADMRTSLDVYSKAESELFVAANALLPENNLSDLGSASTALTNLGGGTAGKAVFTAATVAAIRGQLDVDFYVNTLADLASLVAADVEVGRIVGLKYGSAFGAFGDSIFYVLSGTAVSNGLVHDGVVVVENSAATLTFVRKQFLISREIDVAWFNPSLTAGANNATAITSWLAAGGVHATASKPVTCVNTLELFTGSQHTIPNYVTVDGLNKGWLNPHSTMSLTASVLTSTAPVVDGVRNSFGVKVRRMNFDGAARIYPKWLQNPITLAAIANPAADYSSPGVLDIAQYPAQTIAQVIAANRRNPDAATTHGYLVNLIGVEDGGIEDCYAVNHQSFTFVSAGGLRTHVSRNRLENCGRIDTISPGILVGDFGSAWIVTGISKANPAVITTLAPHTISAAGTFKIKDVNWAGQIADGTLTATAVTSTTLTVGALNTSGFTGIYAVDGRCLVTTNNYIPSEECFIEHNEGDDLKRLFIHATGNSLTIRHNRCRNTKESGIYCVRLIDSNVHDNDIEGITISDVVANGIEKNYCVDTSFRDNRISRVDANGIASIACIGDDTRDNRVYRSGSSGGIAYPYGIFSERYAFGVGSPIIAGTALEAENRAPYRSASFAGLPFTGRFVGNVAEDNRGTVGFNSALVLQRQGGAPTNSIKQLSIEGNDFNGFPTADVNALIDYGTDVIDPQTVHVRGNKKHPSQSAFTAVNVAYAAAASGDQDIDCGFPPSAIEVDIFPPSGATALPIRFGSGSVAKTFAAQGPAAASEFDMAGDGTNFKANARASVLVALQNSAGTLQFSATFVQWLPKGFRLNIGTAVSGAYLRIKCFP